MNANIRMILGSINNIDLSCWRLPGWKWSVMQSHRLTPELTMAGIKLYTRACSCLHTFYLLWVCFIARTSGKQKK